MNQQFGHIRINNSKKHLVFWSFITKRAFSFVIKYKNEILKLSSIIIQVINENKQCGILCI